MKYSPFTFVSKVSSNICSLLSLERGEFRDARVGKDRINLAELRGYLREQVIDVGKLGNVCLDRQRLLPIALAASSRVFWSRPEIATLAPSSRNSLAVAKPMPLFPPVIDNRLP